MDVEQSWRQWFRQDFLRACFVGAALAWIGFGAVGIRYALDPYRPAQGPAPAHVYAVMALFVVGSVIAQVFLYLRWWPSPARREERRPLSGPPGTRDRAGHTDGLWTRTGLASFFLGNRLVSRFRRRSDR